MRGERSWRSEIMPCRSSARDRDRSRDATSARDQSRKVDSAVATECETLEGVVDGRGFAGRVVRSLTTASSRSRAVPSARNGLISLQPVHQHVSRVRKKLTSRNPQSRRPTASRQLTPCPQDSHARRTRRYQRSRRTASTPSRGRRWRGSRGVLPERTPGRRTQGRLRCGTVSSRASRGARD